MRQSKKKKNDQDCTTKFFVSIPLFSIDEEEEDDEELDLRLVEEVDGKSVWSHGGRGFARV